MHDSLRMSQRLEIVECSYRLCSLAARQSLLIIAFLPLCPQTDASAYLQVNARLDRVYSAEAGTMLAMSRSVSCTAVAPRQIKMQGSDVHALCISKYSNTRAATVMRHVDLQGTW